MCRRCRQHVHHVQVDRRAVGVGLRVAATCHGDTELREVDELQLRIGNAGKVLEGLMDWFEPRPLNTIALGFKRGIAKRVTGRRRLSFSDRLAFSSIRLLNEHKP